MRLAIEERAALSPDALTGLEANLRFPGRRDAAYEDLRPSLGVAELGLHSSQRDRRARRAEALRQRLETALRSGARVTHGDRLLPNGFRTTSISLRAARCSARSSSGSREFLDWWKELGPTDFQAARRLPAHRDLASTRRAGRTTATCRCPTTAGASFSPSPIADRTIGFGDEYGQAGVAAGPGRTSQHAAPADRHARRYRAGVGRTAAAARPHGALALRPAQSLSGQRRRRPPPVGDGLLAARLLRPRRPRGGRRLC